MPKSLVARRTYAELIRITPPPVAATPRPSRKRMRTDLGGVKPSLGRSSQILGYQSAQSWPARRPQSSRSGDWEVSTVMVNMVSPWEFVAVPVQDATALVSESCQRRERSGAEVLVAGVE